MQPFNLENFVIFCCFLFLFLSSTCTVHEFFYAGNWSRKVRLYSWTNSNFDDNENNITNKYDDDDYYDDFDFAYYYTTTTIL